jgi:hypothetical protein
VRGPAIYCLDCAYNPGLCDTHDPPHPITREPNPGEERAIRDLMRAITGATIDIARERRLEDRRR